MRSKTSRRKARDKKRKQRNSTVRPDRVDPHVKVVESYVGAVAKLAAEFRHAENPEQALSEAISATIDDFLEAAQPVDSARLIEVARLACLNWSASDDFRPDPESVAAKAELLTLLLLSANRLGHNPDRTRARDRHTEVGIQPITDLVHGKLLDSIDRILHLSLLHDMWTTDRSDPLAQVGLVMRGTQVWIRSSSYPDMVRNLYMDLLGTADLPRALQELLGFDAETALKVLTTCHEIQADRFNQRFITLRKATTIAMSSQDADPRTHEMATRSWTAAWEPPTNQVVVTPSEIASVADLPTQTVQTVLDFFSVDVRPDTAHEVVAEFVRGANPLRIRPVLELSGGYMLVHDADLLPAIRERFEQHLKATKFWDRYAKHRGELLEARTRDAFARVLPNAVFRNGFEYYIPATPDEANGLPSGYSKRVEGDHLIIQDDVALIVEDKAVALSPASREGETQRFRRDLTGIITNAAQQARRLSERIRQDAGIRVHREGWIDLSGIREIHTIAVSLEDLTGISTATAELAAVGILDPVDIPWTVSILDLELITRLVDHPSELLLYLRRRRTIESTIMFTAPDELDLFLHFFKTGLFVEPNPVALRQAFPWMGEIHTAERRRYERQRPEYITSQTDPLDRWHYDQLTNNPSIPKPTMGKSPIRPLLDQIMDRDDYAWLSIGATLLANSFQSQAQLAKIPRDLLRNPFGDGRRRSHTIPAPQSADPADSWLLVWMTSPEGNTPDEWERDARDYLRAKKHQLGLSRGVVFDYNEQVKELAGVYFDDHIGPLDPHLEAKASLLRPPEGLTKNVPPSAKRRPGSRR